MLRQLLGEQTLACPIEWHRPQPATLESLQRVHTRDYVHAFVHGQLDRAAQRRSGFVWSEALVQRVRLETGGTLLTLEAALATGLACNSAGGTHHAHDSGGACTSRQVFAATRSGVGRPSTPCTVG